MTLFKTYFKLLYRNKFMIFLYFLIFIGISVLVSFSASSEETISDYKRINVGIIYEDKSKKNDGLIKYLDLKFNTTNLFNNKDTINNELFYRNVDYIIKIDGAYQQYTIPNSSSGFIVKESINNFINTYDSYTQIYPDKDSQFIVDKTLKTLEKESKITYLAKQKQRLTTMMATYYNNYVYGVLATIIIGVNLITMAFNKPSVKVRENVSSVSFFKKNTIINICHLLFGLLVWFLANLIALYFFSEVMFSDQHLLMVLNSLIFVFPSCGFAYLISKIVSNDIVLSAVSNVVPLFLSFISGAFVPQSLLGPSVMSAASFFFPYWYIKANNEIILITSFDLSVLSNSLLFQLLFMIATISTALAISKYRKN